MATTNHDRVGKALALLKAGLRPYVERELRANVRGQSWQAFVEEAFRGTRLADGKGDILDDSAVLLALMERRWREVFSRTLGRADRAVVSELIAHRNAWAHQEAFSTDEAYRALDSAARLLGAVAAPEAAEVEGMKAELLRLRYEEQVRGQKRRGAQTAVESAPTAGLTPWRSIVTPHQDVATGRYQVAEFAADLWQVHRGEGSAEYLDPVEFFRRTYLTESLGKLLAGAARRLAGQGGDPVVQLQTNFGGGKTHAMLALYHLFSGVQPSSLPGLEDVLADLGNAPLPEVRRVVLVGNRISPGNPVTKPDGSVVRTLWGELAWQLGGAAAYARIAHDDAKATNPGDALRELFVAHGPCLVLIDEWVAYARGLHDEGDLAAGSFETQFTFAQALTESAKAAGNCLLVVSLPASDGPSEQGPIDDVEVGGQRGRQALDRLRNVIGRIESSWKPASAEEGFEIVRRRLFEPITDPALYKARDVVARTFADFYRANKGEFPTECRDADYERRIQAAYPIHPELFDRLYNDWSTLAKFQRTRGVLRLMASVIHNLWSKGDAGPLILPANVDLGDQRVLEELTRNLPDHWSAIIAKDVDGPSSLPQRVDSEVTALGKLSATRRVARAIYIGSAPLTHAAHRGIEDPRIKLGCVLPGETPAHFSDALRRLADQATYLYQDATRYWYATQPTVTKLAADRAAQLARDPDRVAQEIEQRVRQDLRQRAAFPRVHAMPQGSHDVPDDLDVGLVVLREDQPYSRGTESPALAAARDILESRGNAPRLFRNALVFLAADATRLQDLEEAVRSFLAWESILAEQEALNLDRQQTKQAETRRAAADVAAAARIPETYEWLIVPTQEAPNSEIVLHPIRLTGVAPLADRASRRLAGDDRLITAYAPTVLRHELDQVPLWRGDHVSVKQLVEDFARYPYLPRLRDPDVLLAAVRDGIALLTWSTEAFAYADSFDVEAGTYRGLRAAVQVHLPDANAPGLLVRPEIAQAQLARDAAKVEPAPATASDGSPPLGAPVTGSSAPQAAPRTIAHTRYHGSVTLDPERVSRDAGRIHAEVIAHLAGLVGSRVRVTLEIEAEIPDGAPEHVVRTVTENGRTLRFESQGFEEG